MSEVSWKILWYEYVADAYLYGSKIIFHNPEDVEFINGMMPPGKVIKTWYSMVNFQAMRTEPTLPLIDGERRYHMTVDFAEEENPGILFRLVFYDRYENEVESLVLRDREMDFRCPLKTYSYKIELINAGAEKFHFHSFALTEYANENEQI